MSQSAQQAQSFQPHSPWTRVEYAVEGVSYSLSRFSVVVLLGFEAAFWGLALAFSVLVLFHAQEALHLSGAELIQLYVRVLSCTGIGLIAGSGLSALIAKRISPIFIYTPALALIGFGLLYVFQISSVQTYSTAFYLFPLTVGFGSGMFRGRITADLHGVAEEKFHDRILAVRTAASAAGLAVCVLLFSETGLKYYQFEEMLTWAPRITFYSLPIIFILSWMVDIAIYTKKEVIDLNEFPGPIHRLGYCTLRAVMRVVFKLYFRLESVDARNVPETGGVVLVANHSSFLDPLLMACGTDRIVRYVMYASYYRSIAHPFFRFLRCIPADETEHLGALKGGVRSLRLGACIGIFPEGRVSEDGKLNPPMRGALFLAQLSGTPILPVAIKGSFDALPRSAWIPRPAKVKLTYDQPFMIEKDASKSDVIKLTDQLMGNLAKKLDLAPPPKTDEKKVEGAHSEALTD